LTEKLAYAILTSPGYSSAREEWKNGSLLGKMRHGPVVEREATDWRAGKIVTAARDRCAELHSVRPTIAI